ncbi:hypothetical protein G6L37_03740 [Agrobacterium rubi]|nr:hypothetical protein [Agrobacterium rubi]NTF24464.1 hypothetical protein [Agrobacterium rubi]
MFRIPDADPFIGGHGLALSARPAGFQLAVCNYLRRITYKVMISADERDEITSQRYQSYKAMDLIGDQPTGDWADSFDDHEEYRNIGVFLDGRLVGGIRINRITRHQRESAVTEMYPDYVEGMLSKGHSFVEATRFFTIANLNSAERLLPFAIIRLVGVAARHHRASHVVKNVQANHAPFYERHLQAEVVPGSLKSYRNHSRDVPLLLLTARVAPSYTAMLGPLPYLLSTRQEMIALFGPAPDGRHVSPGIVSVLDEREDWA